MTVLGIYVTSSVGNMCQCLHCTDWSVEDVMAYVFKSKWLYVITERSHRSGVLIVQRSTKTRATLRITTGYGPIGARVGK